jgi:hypothetical protein
MSTDCNNWHSSMKILNIIPHLHSSYEKGIIERTVHHINDTTEGFDDYFPRTKTRCKLRHITN